VIFGAAVLVVGLVMALVGTVVGSETLMTVGAVLIVGACGAMLSVLLLFEERRGP